MDFIVLFWSICRFTAPIHYMEKSRDILKHSLCFTEESLHSLKQRKSYNSSFSVCVNCSFKMNSHIDSLNVSCHLVIVLK